MSDDILDEITAGARRPSQSYPVVPAELGAMVLHRSTRRRGRLQRVTPDVVRIRDANGRDHDFRNQPGAFALNGETVILAPSPVSPDQSDGTRRSASGAVVAQHQQARTARASRLWVEGDHDARLVERVWGDELRDQGIVVEPLGGLDNLRAALQTFGPGPGRCIVVLADHLVVGTKEHRIAAAVRSRFVEVVGHPYVDIWQCVRPVALGIDAWPEVPMGEDWKTGICERLGWGTPQQGWRRVLGAVDSFAQLDPALVGAVECALDLLAGDVLAGEGSAGDGLAGEPGKL